MVYLINCLAQHTKNTNFHSSIRQILKNENCLCRITANNKLNIPNGNWKLWIVSCKRYVGVMLCYVLVLFVENLLKWLVIHSHHKYLFNSHLFLSSRFVFFAFYSPENKQLIMIWIELVIYPKLLSKYEKEKIIEQLWKLRKLRAKPENDS